jgi:D-alanyl-D-alanine carboxypeptidase
MSTKISYLLLFLFTMQLSVKGQQFNKAKLDSFFDILEAKDRFMGSVAVSKQGKIIYRRSLGWADFSKKQKVNENTLYRIGSISKTFTAVLVMKAVEEGKLQLDQKLRSFFPDQPNAEKITIEHLLRHQSGIANFTDDSSYLSWNTTPQSIDELTARIAAMGSVFEPGIKSEYSNSNYVLLTYILQKVMGSYFSTLLEHYITKPLGLKNTRLGGKIDVSQNECKSYGFGKSWVEETETDMSIPLGAGAVVSTPSDLVKFSDALMGGKLLKPESFKLMCTLDRGFGFGLFSIPFYEMNAFGHTGGIDGFTSVFSFFKEADLSFALTSNGARIDNNEVSIAVLSALFEKPFSLPEFSDYAPQLADLEPLTGLYTSSQMPLKITVSLSGATLSAQATGQSAFPLDPIAPNRFQFLPAGIEMIFNPAEQSMTLNQGGATFQFKKEPTK